MKKFFGSLAACGLMLSAQVSWAQRDAASKMDGEAYEVDPPAGHVEAEGMEQFEQEPLETEEVRTREVENRRNERQQERRDPRNSRHGCRPVVRYQSNRLGCS